MVKSTAGMKARAEIGKLVVDLLTDKVAEVRKAASFALCSAAGGGRNKTDDWLQVVIMPHLESCSKSSDHRQRLVCLDMLRTLIMKQREEKLWKKDAGNLARFLEILLELSNDR